MIDTEKVKQVIEVIRPAIQADGGDIFLRDVDAEAGIVSVELVGACVSCPASTVTLKAGIERILKDRVPGVTEVVDVGAPTETVVSLCLAALVLRACCSRSIGPPPRPRAALTRGRRWPALISLVERGGDGARAVGVLTHGLGGDAYTVGHHRGAGGGQVHPDQRPVERGARPARTGVAVLAIDPSSPFTGGAILGDRVRMGDHALDDGVFIRSMATRGHLGGLAVAAPEAVRVLAAAGFVGDARDRGRGAGGGRRGRPRRHHGRRRQPGVGRRRAGQQGRAARDRRRVRGQQGRPARRRRGRRRPRAHARPGRPGHGPAWRPPVVPHGGGRRHGRGRRVGGRGRPPGPPGTAGGLEPSAGRRRAADELTRLVAARLLERAAQRDRRAAGRRAGRGGRRAATPTPGPRPTSSSASPAARVELEVRAMPDDPLVQVERRDDGVAVVRLDNPKVNALSTGCCGQLQGAAEELTADPPGAVVVTGGDRIFAAGADIAEFGGPTRPGVVGAGSTAPSTPWPPSPVRSRASHRVRPGRRVRAGPGLRPARSPRSGPSSASPRSCWASSPAAAARSAWPDWSARPRPRT